MKTSPHWEKIGMGPHHGICLMLSSLRSQKSCGIGEFFDLLPLISWCKKVGLDCIQLLPLNDSGLDASPYNALSSCALDPVYLSLRDLPDADFSSSELASFLPLTQMQRVDKNSVWKKKSALLRAYFIKTFPSLSQTADFQTFLQEHRAWLPDYALFKALKREQGNAVWQDWPLELQKPSPTLFTAHRNEIDFESFLQFHAFAQMKKVRAFAADQVVFLKGDIPILLSPDSADVWANRSLFNLELSAGAPPDYYVPEGQSWGFPLYNWDEHRKEGFAWWKKRLKVAEQLFHIYRIDHIVGFFRIWAVPQGKKPLDGHFVPSDVHLWWSQGRFLLDMMIENCSLLPIGEDLGTIPKEVYPILKELGICGTKVIRWQRTEEGKFIPFHEYEPFSMTTLSTADMGTLELWWKKHPEEAVPFCQFKNWSYHPILSNSQRLQILCDAHHTSSFFHINLLQEYLALFPSLIWPKAEDERINIPGTILPTNWTYRFRPYLEEILSHEGLVEAFTTIF